MACTHDHSCEDHGCSSSWSLYRHVDLPKVSALNESVPGGVRKVIKAWERRLDSSEGYLESNEGNPELIVFIPFISDVKIRSISIVGGADGTSPSKMRVNGIWLKTCKECWNTKLNTPDFKVWQTSLYIFLIILGLTLLTFITLALKLKKDAVVNIVYELMPNPSNHKTRAETGGGFSPVE